MEESEFTFEFGREVDLGEAEATLRLALLAAEGVHGEARVRLQATYSVEPLRRTLRLHGREPVVDLVAQLFVSLASREFSREAFTVRPGLSPAASGAD